MGLLRSSRCSVRSPASLCNPVVRSPMRCSAHRVARRARLHTDAGIRLCARRLSPRRHVRAGAVSSRPIIGRRKRILFLRAIAIPPPPKKGKPPPPPPPRKKKKTRRLLLLDLLPARNKRPARRSGGRRRPTSAAAYFFTSSASFRQPAISVGRMFLQHRRRLAPPPCRRFFVRSLSGGACAISPFELSTPDLTPRRAAELHRAPPPAGDRCCSGYRSCSCACTTRGALNDQALFPNAS